MKRTMCGGKWRRVERERFRRSVGVGPGRGRQSSDEVASAVLHIESAAVAVRQLGAHVRAGRAIVGQRQERGPRVRRRDGRPLVRCGQHAVDGGQLVRLGVAACGTRAGLHETAVLLEERPHHVSGDHCAFVRMSRAHESSINMCSTPGRTVAGAR